MHHPTGEMPEAEGISENKPESYKQFIIYAANIDSRPLTKS